MENEKSIAMQLLQDYKKQNKRQFIIILVILMMLSVLLGYTIWLLNDIGSDEEINTQEVADVDSVNGNIINRGDVNGQN